MLDFKWFVILVFFLGVYLGISQDITQNFVNEQNSYNEYKLVDSQPLNVANLLRDGYRISVATGVNCGKYAYDCFVNNATGDKIVNLLYDSNGKLIEHNLLFVLTGDSYSGNINDKIGFIMDIDNINGLLSKFKFMLKIDTLKEIRQSTKGTSLNMNTKQRFIDTAKKETLGIFFIKYSGKVIRRD